MYISYNNMINNIYLCVRSNIDTRSYNCKRFSTYLYADEYLKNYYEDKIINSTLLPIPNYIPTIFHNFILNYKLSKIFINVEIK
jgi:hypothetical protein